MGSILGQVTYTLMQASPPPPKKGFPLPIWTYLLLTLHLSPTHLLGQLVYHFFREAFSDSPLVPYFSQSTLLFLYIT